MESEQQDFIDACIALASDQLTSLSNTERFDCKGAVVRMRNGSLFASITYNANEGYGFAKKLSKRGGIALYIFFKKTDDEYRIPYHALFEAGEKVAKYQEDIFVCKRERAWLNNQDDPVHPGKILEEEWMKPLEATVDAICVGGRTGKKRLYDILTGDHRVTTNAAIDLARYFKTTARYWLDLQSTYDLKTQLKARRIPYHEMKDFQ